MSEVAANDTAVHPAMRQALFQMNTFEEKMIQKLRDEFPNSGQRTVKLRQIQWGITFGNWYLNSDTCNL